MSDQLKPDAVVRLLRAKAADIENRILQARKYSSFIRPIDEVHADVALIAQLLADHIENCHE